MARARLIKPGFFTSDELGKLPPLTRILFAGLWTIADREGRLEDRPDRIKAEVLPYDRCSATRMLTELHDAGFIERYRVFGKAYIQIGSFLKHQSPHMREPVSAIPPPAQAPDEHSAGSVPSTSLASDEHVPSTASRVLLSDPVADPDPDPVSETVTGESVAGAPAPARSEKPKPVKLPKTAITEDWVAEMRERYGPSLRDFDETLNFHMDTPYCRGRDDKQGFLEKKLLAAVERQQQWQPRQTTTTRSGEPELTDGQKRMAERMRAMEAAQMAEAQ